MPTFNTKVVYTRRYIVNMFLQVLRNVVSCSIYQPAWPLLMEELLTRGRQRETSQSQNACEYSIQCAAVSLLLPRQHQIVTIACWLTR